ncbi:MAG: MFS transporter [Firmicutes bacterium]|nr:MFS transporter [Bacillota bacterium]
MPRPHSHPYFSLLARPVTLALWAGQLVSEAGSMLHDMAMLWVVHEMTGSAGAMSAVKLASYLPVAVVGLVGGALVDRWHRLRALVLIDLCRALVVATLPLLYLKGLLSPWALAASGLVLATLDGFFVPALQSSLPALVPPRHLPGAHALLDSTDRLARLLGPGLSSLVLTVVPLVHFFTLNALSFLISALAFGFILLRLGTHPVVRPSGPREPLGWRDLLAGWLQIRSDRLLASALAVRGICNVPWAIYTIGAPLLVAEKFRQSPGAWGLIIAAYGTASLAGNLLAGSLGLGQPGRPVYRPFALSWMFTGLGFGGVGLAPSLHLATAAAFVAGLGSPVVHIVLDSYIGLTVPVAVRGRVFAVQRLVVSGMHMVGLGLAGWVLSRLAPDAGIAVAGAALVGISLCALVHARLQGLDRIRAGDHPTDSAATAGAAG